MQLHEIMSTRVASPCPEDNLEAAQERMLRTGIHHLVVVDRHKVVGVLTDGEANRRLNEGASTVETAMFMPVLTATPEMTVAVRPRRCADGRKARCQCSKAAAWRDRHALGPARPARGTGIGSHSPCRWCAPTVTDRTVHARSSHQLVAPTVGIVTGVPNVS